MREQERAVVICSGGMDSSTLLHYVAKVVGRKCSMLTFNYGQRHGGREIPCAEFQRDLVSAETGNVSEHRIIPLNEYSDLIRGASALLSNGPEVPDLEQVTAADREQPPTVVPNRNLVMLSLATAFATARGIREVYYGAQMQDEYGYWDCTAPFVSAVNNVLGLNRRDPVQIIAPFLSWRKSQIIRLGTFMGVPFEHTWTCYRGGAVSCGTCPTCVERRTAFEEVGVCDPLPYMIQE